ncbi:MAG: ribulose-phosphate 3-epimerase [Candidatus Brocadiaceae bacterium]|nr:ribulose-phosphate 3-epimerase [Candidatus Brocadiaceae bacterium]
MPIKIAPSMVDADLTDLRAAVTELEAGGADRLHVDVADGHFVPNIMLGPYVAAAVARCARVPVGAHLMVTDPVRYAPPFAEAGCDTIFFHAEAVPDLEAAVAAVRELGVAVGVALKVHTPAEAVESLVGRIDCLMAMTVEPGFSGQGFLEEGCHKIPALRRMFGPDLDIYVDGGIGPATAGVAVGYGANVLVAASAVFRADVPPARALQRLREAALAPRAPQERS